MENIRHFFRNISRDCEKTHYPSSFERLEPEEVKTHLRIANYNGFRLPDAVRPAYDLQIIPRCGFRYNSFYDAEHHRFIPCITSAISEHDIFWLFYDMIELLGPAVDVILEISHHQSRMSEHLSFYREKIDVAVLKSIFIDYQDLLVADGCLSISLVNPDKVCEIQLDEHKLIMVYGEEVSNFLPTLKSHGVLFTPDMLFISEGEHVHCTRESYLEKIEQLMFALGISEKF